MKELVWDATLSVDVDEIDDDHQKLVDLFNLLVQSIGDKEAPEYIEAVLNELIFCTIWHFSHEERLMLKYRYEGYPEHKAEHQALIESASDLRDRFYQQGRRIAAQDTAYLEQWLTGHILGTDKELGTFLVEAMSA